MAAVWDPSGPGSRKPDELARLTERELEVLVLVARVSKLGLRDRVQAVVIAYESGLVQPGESAPPR